MTSDILLLTALVLAAAWTVMTPRLMRSVVGLAVTSALLTLLMFRLDAPLAGVFELSVCAGLIPAIFLSTIGLTQRLGPEQLAERKKSRLRRYWALPVLLVLVGALLSQVHMVVPIAAAPAVPEADVREVLWGQRQLDLLGQIVILLGGAFGVVLLVKERKHD
jgi:NADH-quinone oxidoreductase subunit J